MQFSGFPARQICPQIAPLEDRFSRSIHWYTLRTILGGGVVPEGTPIALIFLGKFSSEKKNFPDLHESYIFPKADDFADGIEGGTSSGVISYTKSISQKYPKDILGIGT